MDVFAQIFILRKIRLKLEPILLKIGFNKRGFCPNIDNFWL